MSRIKYFETITNSRGDSLANYRVQVVDSAGAIVAIYQDEAGTRFQDAAGNVVNFTLAGPAGKAEFWWEPASGQILQVLDAAGNLVDSTDGFANKYVLTNLPGNVALNAVDGLDGALGGKVDNTELASTDAGKGSALVGFRQVGDGTASRTIEARAQDTILLSDFTGTTVAKFKAAMVQLGIRGGGTLEVPRGSYNLDSAELNLPINVPGNVTIECNKSVFTITGTAQTNAVFTATNVSNVTIRNGECFGNSKATGYNNGAFFNYFLNNTATANTRNIRVEDFYLENFAANYWMWVENTSVDRQVSGVNFERISFTSRAGNTYNSDITFNASVIAVTAGSPDLVGTSPGRVNNLTILGVFGDATHIKSGVIVYHNVHNAKIDNISVFNAGYSGAIPDDSGSYALQVYDATGLAENVNLRNLNLSGRSCCAYIAGGNRVTVEDFVMFGQTDAVAGTLPKGGLVFNGTVNAVARNGIIRDSFLGLTATGPSLNKRCNLLIDNVEADINVATPLRIEPFNGQDMDGVVVNNCRFVGTGAAGAVVAVGDSSGAFLNELEVYDSHFEAAGAYGFDAFESNLATSSDDWVFEGCTFKGDAVGLRVRSFTGKIEVRKCRAPVTGSRVGYQLIGVTKLDARDLEGGSGTGGMDFDFLNSTGTVGGYMIATGSDPIRGLGSEKPTHSGIKGEFVKNVNFTPAAAGAGQAYTKGWLCEGGTTWRPVRETVDAA